MARAERRANIQGAFQAETLRHLAPRQAGKNIQVGESSEHRTSRFSPLAASPVLPHRRARETALAGRRNRFV
jgi:hypothetical protein